MEGRTPRGERMYQETIRERVERDALPGAEFTEEAGVKLERLGLALEDLRGKQVLDIGAAYGVIARAAHEAGIDSVISLEPRTEALTRRPETSKVAGQVEELPIKTGSLDLVLSISSVPPMSHKFDQITRGFNEMLRVLKSDGEARVWPPRLNAVTDADPELSAMEKQEQQMLEQYDDVDLGVLKEFSRDLAQKKMERSTAWLQDQGYDVTVMPGVQDAESLISFQGLGYWIVRKQKISPQSIK